MHLFIFLNSLFGTLDLKSLPIAFYWLVASFNQFSGALDFTKLPMYIEKIYLHQNGFSGMAEFSKLPDSLEVFNISNTNLEGETRVPKESQCEFKVGGSMVKITLT